MHVKLPYGSETRLVDIPDGWVGNRVLRSPRVEPIADLDSAVDAALQNPICSPPLAEVVPAKADVCLAIDGTCPAQTLLPLVKTLLRWLKSYRSIPADRVKILLIPPPLDRFGPTDDPSAALRATGVEGVVAVGDDDGASPYPLAGTMKSGLPLHLHPVWMGSPNRIAIGFVRPIPLWGYGGGRAVVLPGLADAQTRLRSLSDPDRLASPFATPGNLRDNPFHLLSIEAMQAAPPVFALHVLLNRDGETAAIFAGDPVQGHLAAVNDHRTRFEPALAEPMDIVLTGAGGHPHDATLASSIRSLVSAARLLKPEGTLVALSRCAEGIGPADFEALLRQIDGGPAGFFQRVAQGRYTSPYLPLVHQLCRLLSEHEVLFHTQGIEEDDLWSFGLTPVPDPMEAITLAMETHGQECKIAVVPDGWPTQGRVG